MKYISEIEKQDYVYSFGRVTKIIEEKQIEIEFQGVKKKIMSTLNLKIEVGEWIRFYGRNKDDIIEPIFIIKMPECDIRILEAGIAYVNKNNI